MVKVGSGPQVRLVMVKEPLLEVICREVVGPDVTDDGHDAPSDEDILSHGGG
jgi:hypothetical protein